MKITDDVLVVGMVMFTCIMASYENYPAWYILTSIFFLVFITNKILEVKK